MLSAYLFSALLAVSPTTTAPEATAQAPATQATASPVPSSIVGVTVWQGKTGSLQVGAALPLIVWPSLFGIGEGELVALAGKSEAGLGLGHRSKNLKVEVGKIQIGGALGGGFTIPYDQTQSCTTGKCRSGIFHTVRIVGFLTLPLGTK